MDLVVQRLRAPGAPVRLLMGLITFLSPIPVFSYYRFLITQDVIVQVIIGTARVTSGVKAVLAHAFLMLTQCGCFLRRNADCSEVGCSDCRSPNLQPSIPEYFFSIYAAFAGWSSLNGRLPSGFSLAFPGERSAIFAKSVIIPAQWSWIARCPEDGLKEPVRR